MKITFKTLKQQTFLLDAEETELVEVVKTKIKESRPDDYASSQLKLIYSGKVMEDDKTLADYKVDEKGFIVVMAQILKQPKEIPPEPTVKVAPVATSSSSKLPEVDPVARENVQSEPPVPNTETESAAAIDSSLSTGENALLTGDQLENAVKNIIEMGFEREKVLKALRSSFNNPDRAVEYLVRGIIPDDVPERLPPQQQIAPTTVSQQPPVREADVNQSATNDPASGGNLIQIISQFPQFQQLRALRNNPQLLSSYIQQLGSSNPDLLRLILANEQAFLDFINSEDDGSAEGEQTQQAPQHIIRLTEQEKIAIDRLKALGFREEDVIQAYFACDKNEDLAANFLFSDNQDDAV